MNKAFTLLELLVVVGIMGLLGTVSVGGYRQMQRGMEEKRVVDNVQKFLTLTAERALIDRQPTAMYYWNELLRAETEDEPRIVVGRAVAVRRRGRISRVENQLLIDEYGDLEQFDEDGNYADAPQKKLPSKLYLLDNIQDGLLYSVVRDIPQTINGKGTTGQLEYYMTCDPTELSGISFAAPGTSSSGSAATLDGKIIQYGYYIEDGKSAGSKWKVGSAYGFEFQTIELPHGYVFDGNVPSTMSAPVSQGNTIVFDSNQDSTQSAASRSSIPVMALKANKQGVLTPQKIGAASVPNIQVK